MEVVNFLDLLQVQDILEALQDVHLLRCSLHQHGHAVAEDWHRCEDAQDCEDNRTDWVRDVRFRVYEDYDRGYHHTDALHDVTDYVDYRCSDIHIFVAVSRMAVASA